ncbi:MAG: chorismate mutase [Archangium gephyra]|uniref:chorismate mutase n=1 Tax=Archangium gephyra TaxID=48 RepID=A0A2W5V7Z6_9BACT|nr:MAG: chorismate mutase [Archangium gephyra]
MSLETLRARLDELDTELIKLLARRADIVADVWKWKAENGVPRIDPAREAALRERLLSQAQTLGLSRSAVSDVLDRIVGRSLR